MTDRFNALTVVLEKDIREDDAQGLLDAIQRLRGVQSVTPNVANMDSHIAQERARADLSKKLWEVLHPQKGS